jgi:hypothetical protein
VEHSQRQPISRVSIEQISDQELTALALAADPSVPLDRDAVAWDGAILHQPGLLPDWYMPTPAGSRDGRWPRSVVIGLTVGFLMINAAGLCITSGFISLA